MKFRTLGNYYTKRSPRARGCISCACMHIAAGIKHAARETRFGFWVDGDRGGACSKARRRFYIVIGGRHRNGMCVRRRVYIAAVCILHAHTSWQRRPIANAFSGMDSTEPPLIPTNVCGWWQNDCSGRVSTGIRRSKLSHICVYIMTVTLLLHTFYYTI